MIIEFIDGTTHNFSKNGYGVYHGDKFVGFSRGQDNLLSKEITHIGIFSDPPERKLIKLYPIYAILCIHMNEASLRDSKISTILKD